MMVDNYRRLKVLDYLNRNGKTHPRDIFDSPISGTTTRQNIQDILVRLKDNGLVRKDNGSHTMHTTYEITEKGKRYLEYMRKQGRTPF